MNAEADMTQAIDRILFAYAQAVGFCKPEGSYREHIGQPGFIEGILLAQKTWGRQWAGETYSRVSLSGENSLNIGRTGRFKYL